MQGGPGDDFTNSRDGKRDKVNCGPGDDAVKVDQFDVVRFCERVTVRLRVRRLGTRGPGFGPNWLPETEWSEGTRNRVSSRRRAGSAQAPLVPDFQRENP